MIEPTKMELFIASSVCVGLALFCFRLYRSNVALRQQLNLAQQNHYDALHDELTGLLNRRGSKESIHKMMEHAQAPNKMTFAMLDIDQFKRINDEHGHLVGDQILKDFSTRLKSAFSDENRYTLTRTGGEEFTILACEPLNDFHMKLEQFLESLCSQPFMLSDVASALQQSIPKNYPIAG
jgi:diguanylate cyclase (GGDEF)-like protein